MCSVCPKATSLDQIDHDQLLIVAWCVCVCVVCSVVSDPCDLQVHCHSVHCGGWP